MDIEYLDQDWSDDEQHQRAENDPPVEFELARYMSEEVPFEIPRD